MDRSAARSAPGRVLRATARPHPEGAAPSPWRVGVPLVCLLAGLLLGATHGVSRGGEIRRSDAPRLVDLVRMEQSEVDRLNAERDRLADTIDSTHGRSSDKALAAMLRRSAELAGDAGLDPVHGPGLIVTLERRTARRQRPLPARRLPG